MIKNEISPMTTDIYQDYLKAYRELHPVRQSVIRHEASKELKEEGYEEIGSSDISCRVYDWFKQYGSFEAWFEQLS